MSDVVKSGLAPAEGEEVELKKATGNNVKVELFWSSATFSLAIKKEQQQLIMLLDSKKVTYEAYDIASDKEKREEMFARSESKKPPQLFVDGKFIGSYEEVQYLEEVGELSKLLQA